MEYLCLLTSLELGRCAVETPCVKERHGSFQSTVEGAAVDTLQPGQRILQAWPVENLEEDIGIMDMYSPVNLIRGPIDMSLPGDRRDGGRRWVRSSQSTSFESIGKKRVASK
jgi:hypothetical protein